MKRVKIIILAIEFSEILFILNKSNCHIINTIQFNKVSNSNFKHILKNAFSFRRSKKRNVVFNAKILQDGLALF
jgi:hypothetical protein